MPEPPAPRDAQFGDLVAGEPPVEDTQIAELQRQLARERDARMEDRFIGTVFLVILLDVVFFSIMPNLGGPIALLILELAVLVPLAWRMGLEEVGVILIHVLDRLANRNGRS